MRKNSVDKFCEILKRATEETNKALHDEDQIHIGTKIKLNDDHRLQIKRLIDNGLTFDQVLDKITLTVTFD